MVMTRSEATREKDAEGIERDVELGNIWDATYVPNRWMLYREFQRLFEFTDEHGYTSRGTEGAEEWLEKKMQISEEEAHNVHQTGRG